MFVYFNFLNYNESIFYTLIKVSYNTSVYQNDANNK